MTSVRIGGLQIGIILLTLTTASVHFYLGLGQIFGGDIGGVMFLANTVGYISLLSALYLRLPIDFVAKNHSLIRQGLMAFAAVTILAWLAIGDKSLPAGLLGYATKTIEVVLIALLVIESRQK